ncbi:MAG: hypothetical protein GC154_13015 [bacterium]|nr:hypothetical protein [bacterium]
MFERRIRPRAPPISILDFRSLAMHEYSIVENLIDQLKRELARQGVERVKTVHLRRGSAFAEGALIQAFEMLSQNTPLQDTELRVESVALERVCQHCGHKETVEADDLIGHLHICSNCGHAEQIDEGSGLELLGVDV